MYLVFKKKPCEGFFGGFDIFRGVQEKPKQNVGHKLTKRIKKRKENVNKTYAG